MDFTYNPYTKEAKVKLSRTNLMTLIHKLDGVAEGKFDSVRTLTRTTENDWLLHVIAEEDKDHYGSRERGIMDGPTEKALREG